MVITVALFQQSLARLRAYTPGIRKSFFFIDKREDITIFLVTFG